VPAGSEFLESLPATHNAFVYVINGQVSAENTDGEAVQLGRDDLGVLNQGDAVSLRAGEQDARFLLIAGKPLREPVARGGPFVMNTKAEVQQAFEDYQQGKF
jgi:redox-sensitive bicupin YhaK (pirin superfamily)